MNTAVEVQMRQVEGNRKIARLLHVYRDATMPLMNDAMSRMMREAAIDAHAESIMRELHSMCESARRSTAQRFRYLQERTDNAFDEARSRAGMITPHELYRRKSLRRARSLLSTDKGAWQWHQ